MAKDSGPSIGVWAFLAGLAIAVIVGFVPTLLSASLTALILGVLGIIVGLLNITDKEVQAYLLAGVALVVAAGGLYNVFSSLGIPVVNAILSNIQVFVAPGVGVVALKAIYEVSRSD